MALDFSPTAYAIYEDNYGITGWPFTMFCVARTDDTTNFQSVFAIQDKDATNYWSSLNFRGDSSDAIGCWSHFYGGSSQDATLSTGAYAADTWYAIGGTFYATSTDLYVDYLTGKSLDETVNSTFSSKGASTAHDRVSLGRTMDSSPAQDFNGQVAVAAIWDVALTPAEHASLAARVSPFKVRPQSLKFNGPLVRDSRELMRGVVPTESGTIVAAPHPAVYRPSAQILQFPAPSGVSAAVLRRRRQ